MSEAQALFKKVWRRECFIEVYIDNQCKIVIVYHNPKLVGSTTDADRWIVFQINSI